MKSIFFRARSFLLRIAPHYLNAWNRPDQKLCAVHYLSVGKKELISFRHNNLDITGYYYRMAILHRTVYLPRCRWFYAFWWWFT